MSEFKAGAVVSGRYTLQECKGSGSFGEVWAAKDELLGTTVAIKIYIPLDDRGAEEFKGEIRTTMGLHHPNILTPQHYDVWGRYPYLVMQHCARGSAAALCGDAGEYDIWKFIRDVAGGLDYLHDQPEPVIHQDIKPENILVGDGGRYLITDFGISKRLRATMTKMSGRTLTAGAVAYMAPERFAADPSPVKASDIWSLGVSVWELAMGKLPFEGMGGAVLRNGGAELPELDYHWSRELNAAMRACMAPAPWDRPRAAELAAYADGILRGTNPTASWTCQLPAGEPDQSAEVAQSAAMDDAGNADVAGDNGGGSGRGKSRGKSGGKSRGKGRGAGKSDTRIFTILGICAALLVAGFILLLRSGSETESGEPAASNELMAARDSVENAESAVAAPPDESARSASPSSSASARASTPTTGQPSANTAAETQTPRETAPKEDKAERLRRALASGDSHEIYDLAASGYPQAYVPAANAALGQHNYDMAHRYAQKAKNAGIAGAQNVIDKLESLGYYD